MRRLVLLLPLALFLINTHLIAQLIKDFPGDEDPRARAAYEAYRLRDPKTGKIPAGMRQKEIEFARSIPTREALLRSGNYKGVPGGELQSLAWSQRGPINVGGRTRALGVDVTNENIILAGGVSGGLWRSTDGGSTWALVSGISNLHSITCIAQDIRAGHTNTWYYGTGELDGNSATGGGAPYRGDGYYKSTDDGITWTKLTSTSSGTPQSFDNGFEYCWNIAIDVSNTAQDEIYAATFGAISRSTDGGATWTTVLGGYSTTENNGSLYSRYSDVLVTSTGIVYAALSQENQAGSSSASAGVWRSTDGITWTNISDLTFPALYNRVVLGLAPSNENVVYVLAETPGSGHQTSYVGSPEDHSFWKYTYISGDGSGAGGSWSDRSGNLPSYGQPVGEFASQGGYDLVVKVKPDNENVVYLGATDLFRSTNGFADTNASAWIGGYATSNNVSQYPNHHPDQHAIVFSSIDPSVMWSGNDGGVQKTTNDVAPAVSWIWLNNGYFTTQFYTIAIDHATVGNDVIIGGTQDNGTWFTNTTDAGISWGRILGGDGTYCAVADGRSSYYASFPGGPTYRLLLNSGGGMTGFTRVDPTGGSGYLFVNPFILNPNNSGQMYLAGGTRIWRNDDLTSIPLSSNSTTLVNWVNMTNTNVASTTVTALDLSTAPANRLYYGRSNGHVYRVDDANNGNPPQTDVTGAAFPAGGYVSSIAIDPTNADNVLVVFSNYIVQSLFYTTDGGTSWTPVGGNLEQFPNGTGDGPSVRWAKIATGAYFVGTSTGLYSTFNLNGMSTVWAQEGSAEIGNSVVDMIDFRRLDGRMVVATHGNGIYSAYAIVAAPAAPALLFPPDSATNQVTSLPMQWTSTLTSTEYELQVATDSVFGSIVFDDSTLTDTVKLAGPFANFTTHFWHVRARNNVGWSPYSAARRFTTGFTAVSTTVNPYWNLLSVPVTLLDYSRSAVFPTSIAQALKFTGTYVATDTLGNQLGYWVRFSAGGPLGLAGNLIASDTIDVVEGWNLIGSISTPVAASDVSSDPDTLISSSFYAYHNGYALADTIQPMLGHWVRMSGSGQLILSTGGLAKPSAHRVTAASMGVFNSIQLSDAKGSSQKLWFGTAPAEGISLNRYELPPMPPAGIFDVRYASNRSLVLGDANTVHRYPIRISSASYPVRISWTTNREPFQAWLAAGGRTVSMQAFGSVEIADPDADITLILGSAPQLPTEFSLEQNYPNPFNPSTVMKYRLPVDSRVRLQVYDVLGQRVATLVDGIQPAGFKQVEWNAAGLASGVYLYRMDAVAVSDPGNTFSDTRKMFLLK